MPSFPSQLYDRLHELRLCHASDLDACAPTIRRLYRGLPEFESVWLDALVQRRVITPWQADRLLEHQDHTIVAGDVTLTDQCGPSSYIGRAGQATVFVHELESGDSSPAATFSRQNPSAEDRSGVRTRLRRLLEELPAGLAPDSVALPDRLLELDNGRAVVVTAFVAGWSADSLLVRGGRLPWPAAAEIGRQLLTGLRQLEEARFLHGEITAANLRLQADGRAVLVSPFLQQLQRPTVSIAAIRRLRDVEGVAPERVGAGRPVDARSELYSLGCLLWQLLTARPPFLSADPVTMLHQARSAELPLLRELVPDCPEWLAAQIHAMTRRSAELRPESFAAACANWPSRSQPRAVRAVLKTLPDQQQARSAKPSGRRVSQSLLAGCLLLPLFGFYAWYRGLVPQTLSLSRETPVTAADTRQGQTGHKTDHATDHTAESETPAADPHAVLPLPQPDLAGVVLLQSGRIYVASALDFAGVMHIEADGREMAVVRVPSTGWQVTASHVVLSGVHVVAQDLSAPPDSGLLITSHMLSVQDCVVGTPETVFAKAGVVWTPRDGQTRVLTVRNSEFSGSSYGLWLQGAPGRMELSNVLFRQDGGALRLDARQLQDVRCELSRVTQVGGHAFWDVVPKGDSSSRVNLALRCGESVLAPSAAVIRVAPPETLSAEAIRVEFLLPERGNPAIVPPDVDPVVYFDRSLRQFTELNSESVLLDALLLAKPVFRGAQSGTADPRAAWELVDYQGPKLNAELPGFRQAELPQVRDTTVNPSFDHEELTE
ncbi:MAG: hypothetical protein NXI04_13295 [Planctomycetaceae bacterium]|nr:hypothetical protein [Planctomycetaceae bacterium]